MQRILIVDDDKVILRTLQAMLEKYSYSVVTAVDGHDAYEKIQQEKFNLVITDINMPHQFNGFRLMKVIREDARNKTTPVVVLTGRNNEIDVLRTIQAGADDYIVKPINVDVFLAKIENLMGLKNKNPGFYTSKVEYSATWLAHLKIVGISEQGLIFKAPLPLPIDLKFKIESPLFTEIGMAQPFLRIYYVSPIDPSDQSYHVETSFVGLGETDFQLIRRWVMKNNLNKMAA